MTEVGEAGHAAWKKWRVSQGYPDHAWSPDYLSIGCEDCGERPGLHHEDMVPWEELSPEKRQKYIVQAEAEILSATWDQLERVDEHAARIEALGDDVNKLRLALAQRTKDRLADRLFDADRASNELTQGLEDAGVLFRDISWDPYDESVELTGVGSKDRLAPLAQRFLYDAGFRTAYVNHTDGWETHYNFDQKNPFEEQDGWRVSYPHKRGESKGAIWVEKVVDSWPSEWFETGYCIIKKSDG